MNSIELCVITKRPVRLPNGDFYDRAGLAIRVTGQARACLTLLRQAVVEPDLRIAATPSSGEAPNSLAAAGIFPSSASGEPTSLDGVKRRYKKVLLKEAAELSLTSPTPPAEGQSWFDLVAERRWAKLNALRDRDRDAEEAAYLEIQSFFASAAERKEQEATAALAAAQEMRERAGRAVELLSHEHAARELKLAQDTLATFEQLKDPRAGEARTKLAAAEDRFAAAELAKSRYESRVAAQRAFDEISRVRSAKAKDPRAVRISAAQLMKFAELEQRLQVALKADDFDDIADAIGELQKAITPASAFTGGTNAAITGIAL